MFFPRLFQQPECAEKEDFWQSDFTVSPLLLLKRPYQLHLSRRALVVFSTEPGSQHSSLPPAPSYRGLGPFAAIPSHSHLSAPPPALGGPFSPVSHCWLVYRLAVAAWCHFEWVFTLPWSCSQVSLKGSPCWQQLAQQMGSGCPQAGPQLPWGAFSLSTASPRPLRKYLECMHLFTPHRPAPKEFFCPTSVTDDELALALPTPDGREPSWGDRRCPRCRRG